MSVLPYNAYELRALMHRDSFTDQLTLGIRIAAKQMGVGAMTAGSARAQGIQDKQ